MAGTSYNGLPSNVLANPANTIISSTNASPIVMQVTAHGLKTGDWVDVSGHATNTNANGIWNTVVVDANHFQLVGSTGNGVGGSTGTATSLVFSGNVSLNPADGDPYDASTYVPGMSCLADRTSFLAKNLGAWKLARIQTFQANSDSNTLWVQQTNVTNAWALPNSVPSFEVLNIVGGDFIDISLASTGVANGGGASLCLFGIMYALVAPGVSPTGLYSKLPGSNQGVAPSANPVPLQLRGASVFSGSGNLFISPGFYAIGGSGTSFSMQGDYTIVVYVWRQTGWPQ